MNVLSLFDGISCGRIALDRAGIQYGRYFASEIDEYCIQIVNKNYPSTTHLGDITGYKDWNLPPIDLVMGGSPCQGFSFAGNQLNFNDPRSKLFFEFIKVLGVYKPKYFLLENVKMSKKSEKVISDQLGRQPIEINSALVSAQNRKRLYWTNIPVRDNLPEDKKIMLRDILIDHDLRHTDKAIEYMNRKVTGGRTHWDFKHHSDTENDKSQAVVANFFKGVPYNVLKDGNIIKKFHPIEAERLQTLPDNYTEGVSNTQRYKMIGNGWTVDVISHILNYITKGTP